MATRLVREDPPNGVGRGGAKVDIRPMLSTLDTARGQWFRYPRDYSGYPNGMKKRFAEEGIDTTVAPMKNDDGVTIGYQLYVRMPVDGTEVPADDDAAADNAF